MKELVLSDLGDVETPAKHEVSLFFDSCRGLSELHSVFKFENQTDQGVQGET